MNMAPIKNNATEAKSFSAETLKRCGRCSCARPGAKRLTTLPRSMACWPTPHPDNPIPSASSPVHIAFGEGRRFWLISAPLSLVPGNSNQIRMPFALCHWDWIRRTSTPPHGSPSALPGSQEHSISFSSTSSRSGPPRGGESRRSCRFRCNRHGVAGSFNSLITASEGLRAHDVGEPDPAGAKGGGRRPSPASPAHPG